MDKMIFSLHITPPRAEVVIISGLTTLANRHLKALHPNDTFWQFSRKEFLLMYKNFNVDVKASQARGKCSPGVYVFLIADYGHYHSMTFLGSSSMFLSRQLQDRIFSQFFKRLNAPEQSTSCRRKSGKSTDTSKQTRNIYFVSKE